MNGTNISQQSRMKKSESASMLHYSNEYISYLVNTFILFESVSRMLSNSGLLKRNLHMYRFMNAERIASIYFGTP